MSTNIAWTNETWNPVTGCSKVSDGCRNCYAERLSLRFGWSNLPWTARNAPENVIVHPDRLRKPYSWKKPTRVFVNSMSDLFHDRVPDEFIAQVFQVMNDLPQHTFQVLTKRPERAAAWPGPWGANIWMGTSVEDSRALARIDSLRQCKARTRFLSAEPLLGPLEPLDLSGIHWVIVGGETGPGYRAMDPEWARAVRDRCLSEKVAFFFKQDSAPRPGTNPLLDGLAWEQYPSPAVDESPRLVAVG